MFSPLLFLSVACLAILSGEAKLVWRSSNDLYYFKNDKLNYNKTLETCTLLGGQVPSAGNRTDSEFLTKNAAAPTWLFASKDRGGYRWSDSLKFIDSNLWAEDEPDCSGRCAAIVRNGKLFAVKTDTPNAYACQFDITSDIQLQKVLSNWRGFESADQQSLVEYVLKRQKVAPMNTEVANPLDLKSLTASMSKLQELMSSTKKEVGDMRQENKKTVASFKQALQVSLSSLDSKNYNETLAKLLA